MIKNSRNKYVETQVKLDDNEFIDCKFERCILEFNGTGTVSLINCSFDSVSWVFSGPAQNTLNFLHGIYHGMGEGGKALVEATFNNIRSEQK